MSEVERLSEIIKRILPMKGEIMLCDNCRKWADTIQVKSHQPPWQHCHHELEQPIKPGEKLKDAVGGGGDGGSGKIGFGGGGGIEKPKEDVIKWAENHYWNSLEKDKDLIVKHIKEGYFKEEKL